MNPKPGQIYNVSTGEWEAISSADTSNFKFTHKTIKLGNERCAEFENNGITYLQSWEKLSFLRKRGSQNINAKLTESKLKNALIDIFVNGAFVDEVAEKLGITLSHLKNIIQGHRSWTWLTKPFLTKLAEDPSIVVKEMKSVVETNSQAKTQKNNKLNSGLVKFIVRDHFIHGLKTKDLSNKYHVSVRQIQRILSGKAWKSQVLIDEYKNWEDK